MSSIGNSYTSNGADASGVYLLGITSVSYTAIDMYGNSSTCTTLIKVEDNEAPTVVCGGPVTLDLIAGGVIRPLTLIEAAENVTIIDNCGATLTGLSESNFTCADAGEQMVTVTVTDGAGNTSTCDLTVIVPTCCTPAAGNIVVSDLDCTNQDIIAEATGFNDTAEYDYYFILTDATGQMLEVIQIANLNMASATATFSGYTTGSYVVYGYSVSTVNAPVPAPADGGAFEPPPPLYYIYYYCIF